MSLALCLIGCTGGDDASTPPVAPVSSIQRGVVEPDPSGVSEQPLDGRYELVSLEIDGTEVESWTVGHETVAKLVVTGESWRFEACNRLDATAATHGDGGISIELGAMTAVACGDDWLSLTRFIDTYRLEEGQFVLEGPGLVFIWRSAA